MILKYIVPIKYSKIYDNKKVVYCKILRKSEVSDRKVYLVDMLNVGRSNVFADDELQKLNLWDKIKAKFM